MRQKVAQVGIVEQGDRVCTFDASEHTHKGGTLALLHRTDVWSEMTAIIDSSASTALVRCRSMDS